MPILAYPSQWILGSILILSSIGVITARRPVYASLCFFLSLLMLAALYLQLSAEFIALMQILIYAGAILVIFMFVIVLFQDAHYQLSRLESHSASGLLTLSAAIFAFALLFLGTQLAGLLSSHKQLPEGYGMVESLGQLLYIDFFFPFEAVLLLFLVSIVGALYIGRKN